MPGAKSWSQAVQLGHFAVVLAGERENFRHCVRVFAFNTVQEVWAEWASVLNYRCGAASDGICLIVAGGTAPSTGTPISHVYELKKDRDGRERLPSMPKACMTCSSAIIKKNKLYVMCNEAEKHYGTIIQVMNLEDNSWSEIVLSSTIPGRVTSGSNKHCLAALDNSIVSDQLVVYDTASGRSKDLPSRPESEPYAIQTLAVIGGRLLAFGENTLPASDEVHMLSSDHQRWKELPPMTTARYCPAACTVIGVTYVVGGRETSLLPLRTVECFKRSNFSESISKRHSFYTTTKTSSIAKWTRYFVLPDRNQRNTLLQTIKPETFVHFDHRIFMCSIFYFFPLQRCKFTRNLTCSVELLPLPLLFLHSPDSRLCLSPVFIFLSGINQCLSYQRVFASKGASWTLQTIFMYNLDANL